MRCNILFVDSELSGEISAKELRERARELGLRGTPKEFASLRRYGLLRVARRAGLGRGKGTQTIYAAGSVEQIQALAPYLKRPSRDHSRVVWRFWWDGGTVDMYWIRERINSSVSGLGSTRRRFVDGVTGKIKPGGKEFVSKTATMRPVAGIGPVRERLGGEWVLVIELVLKMIVGVFPDGLAAAGAREVFAKAFGVPEDRLDLGAPLLKELLRIYRGTIDAPAGVGTAPFSDEQLFWARAAARSLIASLRPDAEVTFGRGPMGFAAHAFGPELVIQFQALVVLLLLRLKSDRAFEALLQQQLPATPEGSRT